MRMVISAGHGKYVPGAIGPAPWGLNEVDEARRVMAGVAAKLREIGIEVLTYADDVSRTQSENLNRIVDFHNAQTRDLDVSIHFNANVPTSKPMGSECLYLTQDGLAEEVAAAVAGAAGLPDRGGKKRTDLYFLNNTEKPAVLVEVCFVDSEADANAYRANFDAICQALGYALATDNAPPAPQPEPVAHPTIRKGDKGAAVEGLQIILGIVPIDGDFGSITDGGVRGFQAAWGLTVDGIVGPDTWAQLDELKARKVNASEPLDPVLIDNIVEIAGDSRIASYPWKERGIAPIGYTCGVACCFALALTWLRNNDPGAQQMARAETGNTDKDALSWYRQEFVAKGMDNSRSGVDTLRHLFVLLMGLGMRESSGRYPEGRDMSASNVTADTAEAGAWQTSWNIRSADSTIPPLLPVFWLAPRGFLSTFQAGVWPDSNDLPNYGNGEPGTSYQFLSKYAPAFHAMVTAIGLRSRRQHWGPINRKEAEIRQEADEMLRAVQNTMELIA